MKKLIFIMLAFIGLTIGAKAQTLVTCTVDTATLFGNTGTSCTSSTGTTSYVYCTAGSATQYATITLKMAKVQGAPVYTVTPVVSNDGVTWSPLFQGAYGLDSVSYTSGVAFTGTISRSRLYPIGFKYIGQKVVISGTNSVATISGKAYIK